jgi:3-dehydroquinate synthase
MKTLKVNLPQNQYEIKIGPGLLGGLGDNLSAFGFKDKVVLITNPEVRRLYGNGLRSHMQQDGYKVAILEVPEGEEQKSLERAGQLYTELAEFQAERMTPIVALGGGVIGDLAGFVAATYMRGVPLIQLPTTLLAMVDSSIGGKTAVNHGRLKNNVGTFYQPRLVVSDISALSSLPVAEFENGLAECIKYGIISDAMLFSLIEREIERIKAGDQQLRAEMIFRCASIKASLVEMDEKDLGVRNILNLGHTTGHAIESVSGLKISHGRAVAIGLVTASLISYRLGQLSGKELARIKALIARAGLPTKLPAGLNKEKIIQAMQYDKKRADGKVRFVLPRKIGEVFMQDETNSNLLAEVLVQQSE